MTSTYVSGAQTVEGNYHLPEYLTNKIAAEVAAGENRAWATIVGILKYADVMHGIDDVLNNSGYTPGESFPTSVETRCGCSKNINFQRGVFE